MPQLAYLYHKSKRKGYNAPTQPRARETKTNYIEAGALAPPICTLGNHRDEKFNRPRKANDARQILVCFGKNAVMH